MHCIIEKLKMACMHILSSSLITIKMKHFPNNLSILIPVKPLIDLIFIINIYY